MKLEINENVKVKDPSHKVYCQEDYAQELYDIMFGDGRFHEPIKSGSIVEAKIVRKNDSEIMLESGSDTIFVDVGKEKKSKEVLLKSEIGNMLEIRVDVTEEGYLKGSMDKAHEQKVIDSLFQSLTESNCAFKCKVFERNKGGFWVDIDGITCFLPGGLAAANKLNDFDELLGKEVPVMVANWIKETNTFIVSNKKYIQAILPQKVKELETMSKEYTGIVTGTIKFGAFVQWDDIFTGLLHVNEMTPESKKEFRSWKSGQEIKFRIKSIEDVNRIVLTEKTEKEEN